MCEGVIYDLLVGLVSGIVSSLATTKMVGCYEQKYKKARMVTSIRRLISRFSLILDTKEENGGVISGEKGKGMYRK